MTNLFKGIIFTLLLAPVCAISLLEPPKQIGQAFVLGKVRSSIQDQLGMLLGTFDGLASNMTLGEARSKNGEHTRRATDLVLMVDTRFNAQEVKQAAKAINDNTIIDAGTSYSTLSYLINGAYAQRMGYDFQYFQFAPHSEGMSRTQLLNLQNCLDKHDVEDDLNVEICLKQAGQDARTQLFQSGTVCSHGEIAWCKLVAFNHLFKTTSYDRIIYVDNDAYFHTWDSVAEFFQYASNYIAPKWSGYKDLEERPGQDLRNATLITPVDALFWKPDAGASTFLECFSGRPQGLNAGIEIWKPSSKALDIVQDWWREGNCTQKAWDCLKLELWPAEQGVLEHKIAPRYQDDVLRIWPGKSTWGLSKACNLYTDVPDGKWIRHVTSGFRKKRRAQFMRDMMQNTISEHAQDLLAFVQGIRDGDYPGVVSFDAMRAETEMYDRT